MNSRRIHSTLILLLQRRNELLRKRLNHPFSFWLIARAIEANSTVIGRLYSKLYRLSSGGANSVYTLSYKKATQQLVEITIFQRAPCDPFNFKFASELLTCLRNNNYQFQERVTNSGITTEVWTG